MIKFDQEINMDQKRNRKSEQELEKKFLLKKSDFFSPQDAITFLTNELESLAEHHGLPVELFLLKAESSVIDHDDFFKALSLAKRISFLKQSAI